MQRACLFMDSAECSLELDLATDILISYQNSWTNLQVQYVKIVQNWDVQLS